MPCDENCPACLNRRCVYHPQHKTASSTRGYLATASSYREWFEGQPPLFRSQKICAHCGQPFTPNSPNQKYCSREDNPACADDRWLQGLSRKAFIRRTGLSTAEFIEKFGKETYQNI